jgi:hypothetical protein
MDLDPKFIFVQRERNLGVHHPVIKLVATLARTAGSLSPKFTGMHLKLYLITNFKFLLYRKPKFEFLDYCR